MHCPKNPGKYSRGFLGEIICQLICIGHEVIVVFLPYETCKHCKLANLMCVTKENVYFSNSTKSTYHLFRIT